MPISTTSCSYSRPKFAIASLSLGTNGYHDLPAKIRVTHELGYDGIEMFIPDFEHFIDQVREGEHAELFTEPVASFASSAEFDLDLACATAIYDLCKSLNLEIPLFQPLRNFENFHSQAEMDTKLAETERWLRIMPAMKCDLLLVCSNYIPPPYPICDDFSMDMYCDVQVDAFRQLGALAARYGIRIGYEPLSFGTVIDNLMQVWDVVKRVDRENVGVILDSFNVLANQYADPGQPSTIRKGQTLSTTISNLAEMSRTIPAEKIFFYQIADAVRPAVVYDDEDGMPRRMRWSRTCRVFPCEPSVTTPNSSSSSSYYPSDDPENPPSGYLGFLPVTQMTSLVHRAGYRGWWSLEVFNSSLQEKDSRCPERHGRRGINGLHSLWEVVQRDLDLQQSLGIIEFGASNLDREPMVPSPTPSTPTLSTGSLSDSATSSDSDVEKILPSVGDHSETEARKGEPANGE